MEHSHSWEGNSHLDNQEFPIFYGIWSFNTFFTRACYWSLSWVRWIQSTHYFFKVHVNSIILSMPISPKWFVLLGFPTKILHSSFVSAIYTTLPAYPILCDLITLKIFGEEYKLWSSSFLQPPINSLSCSSIYLLSTLNLCTSHRVRDQISHPYKKQLKL